MCASNSLIIVKAIAKWEEVYFRNMIMLKAVWQVCEFRLNILISAWEV